jgi:hypothetical protein
MDYSYQATIAVTTAVIRERDTKKRQQEIAGWEERKLDKEGS